MRTIFVAIILTAMASTTWGQENNQECFGLFLDGAQACITMQTEGLSFIFPMRMENDQPLFGRKLFGSLGALAFAVRDDYEYVAVLYADRLEVWSLSNVFENGPLAMPTFVDATKNFDHSNPWIQFIANDVYTSDSAGTVWKYFHNTPREPGFFSTCNGTYHKFASCKAYELQDQSRFESVVISPNGSKTTTAMDVYDPGSNAEGIVVTSTSASVKIWNSRVFGDVTKDWQAMSIFSKADHPNSVLVPDVKLDSENFPIFPNEYDIKIEHVTNDQMVEDIAYAKLKTEKVIAMPTTGQFRKFPSLVVEVFFVDGSFQEVDLCTLYADNLKKNQSIYFSGRDTGDTGSFDHFLNGRVIPSPDDQNSSLRIGLRDRLSYQIRDIIAATCQ